MTDEARLRSGLEVRKEVVGADHVERSLANATEFSRPLQNLVTEYCWGEIWTRDGLSRRDRSLLNLAMLTALGHEAELKLHARGALRNGCGPEEIRETILQAAIYCGVPAALAAQRQVEAALEEAGVDLETLAGPTTEAAPR